MQHRDCIVLKKVQSELNLGEDMLGSVNLQEFLDDEEFNGRSFILSVLPLCVQIIYPGRPRP